MICCREYVFLYAEEQPLSGMLLHSVKGVIHICEGAYKGVETRIIGNQLFTVCAKMTPASRLNGRIIFSK